MTEAEVVRILRQHYETLFPKNCSACNRRFETLREYMLSTTPLGPPQSYDAELGEWDTTEPIGSVVMSNCSCGSTLALSTQALALPQRLALLQWLRGETQRCGLSPAELLQELRAEIREQVLSSGPADAV